MKVKPLLLIFALVYTGAIAYLSLINLAQTPVSEFGMSDKLMHGGAYFGLALLWLLHALFSPDKDLIKRIVVICVLSIVFGIFIEVLQRELTDYRELDIYDILANSIGAIAACLLVWIFRKSLMRLKTKINSFLLKK